MGNDVAVPPGAIHHSSRLAADLGAERRTASVLATATLLLAVAYGCVAQGGFYPGQQRVLLALVALSGAFAVLAAPGRRVLAHAAIAVPAWACGVGAAVVARDVAGAEPVVAIVAAAAVAALVTRSADREARETLVSGLLVAGVALALSGWIGVAVRHDPLALVDQGLWRASSTLTYANATAAVLAPLALVALARATAEPRQRRWRLATFVLVVGVAATLSRAGWAALAIGGAVLVWRTGWRRTTRVTLPILVGAAIATAGVVAVAPARLPSRPALATVTLLIGMAISCTPVRRPGRWLVAAALLAVGGLFIGAAFSSSRLTVSSPDRDNEWRATWAVASAHPLAGVGPSKLRLQWRGANGDTYVAHATHNEFLQLAAEQGFPALAVALATFAVIGVALARRAPPAGLAVLVAFLVASAFDFMWHVTLIPILVAALVGAALPFSDSGYGRPAPTRLGL